MFNHLPRHLALTSVLLCAHWAAMARNPALGGPPIKELADKTATPQNAASTATGGADLGAPVVLASQSDCVTAANDPKILKASEPYQEWVFLDASGAVCNIPKPLKQRDKLRFAVVSPASELPPLRVDVRPTDCTTPTWNPVVTGSFALQGGSATVPGVTLSNDSFACQSDTVGFDVTVTPAGGTPVTRSIKQALSGRTNATLQVGILSSRLDDTDYGLVTKGEQTLVTDKSAQTRGPKYVATVVIQGFPHYVQDLFGTKGPAYPGRDMLHDNEFADKLGLAFAFGLKDPTKRFGVGLSYEIVTGINVIGVREWVNRSTLDGVKVGDAFAGAATDIPTRREWAHDWAIGLTFDMSYLGKLLK